jgi:hypothetical protein
MYRRSLRLIVLTDSIFALQFMQPSLTLEVISLLRHGDLPSPKQL